MVYITSLDKIQIFFIHGVERDWVFWYWGHKWTYCTSPSWQVREQSTGGMILGKENWRTYKKFCTWATLFITNYIWTVLEFNLGFCDEKSVTNHLNNGMAIAISGTYCKTHSNLLVGRTDLFWISVKCSWDIT